MRIENWNHISIENLRNLWNHISIENLRYLWWKQQMKLLKGKNPCIGMRMLMATVMKMTMITRYGQVLNSKVKIQMQI